MAQRKFTEEVARERKNARQREYNKKTGYAAQNKYHRDKMKAYTIRMMLDSDSDIINHIEKIQNKSEYIKSLIRADIAKEQSE